MLYIKTTITNKYIRIYKVNNDWAYIIISDDVYYKALKIKHIFRNKIF
jgi:hypothetical protein